jgi:aminoglycoside phosphotransferase (APT) family kinase protein
MKENKPDIDALMDRVRQIVQRRREAGSYDDPLAAQAERTRFAAMAREEDSLGDLLAQLHLVNWVDFRDPGLSVPRSPVERLEGAVKKIIWRVLKFYHLRLFGQQNRVNKLLLLGMDDYHKWLDGHVRDMDRRLSALEALGKGDSPPAPRCSSSDEGEA